MSSAALHLYEQLSEATDDKTRAKIIAEAFSQHEDRYPHLKEIATESHVRESELRLQKEIEVKIKEVEVKIKEVEGKIKDSESRLTRAIYRQTLWIIGSVGTVIAAIHLLEWLLTQLS
ncbi:MAG: hypothetical protein CVV13_05190 [Gammaproteobacteria bacterium HGW-Gammaproteobacteria-3]|nr:MAG: hypothetical protein CVV13_05190 [Gammaproteobacteria bacterium HGW-Gammaproteobacteria-3]